MKRRKLTEMEREAEALLGPRERAILAFGNEVQTWLRIPLKALWQIERTDAVGIHQWMVETLDAAGHQFGLRCPTSMIVTSANGHADPDSQMSPAYCALREAERQRDAVGRILSRVAYDDGLWNALLEPLNVNDDICCSDVTGDTALLILIAEYYGKAADAVWRVIETWHLEQFGRGPMATKAQFEACVRR